MVFARSPRDVFRLVSHFGFSSGSMYLSGFWPTTGIAFVTGTSAPAEHVAFFSSTSGGATDKLSSGHGSPGDVALLSRREEMLPH
jgi:hypothetical protein